jgi:hypothetical protein
MAGVRKIYYVRFKNEDGTYKNTQSLGQTSKEAALQGAYYQLASGEVVTNRNTKFRDYVDVFSTGTVHTSLLNANGVSG